MSINDTDPNMPKTSLGASIAQGLGSAPRRRARVAFKGAHRQKDGTLIPVEVNANFVEYEGKEYMFVYSRATSPSASAWRRSYG